MILTSKFDEGGDVKAVLRNLASCFRLMSQHIKSERFATSTAPRWFFGWPMAAPNRECVTNLEQRWRGFAEVDEIDPEPQRRWKRQIFDSLNGLVPFPEFPEPDSVNMDIGHFFSQSGFCSQKPSFSGFSGSLGGGAIQERCIRGQTYSHHDRNKADHPKPELQIRAGGRPFGSDGGGELGTKIALVVSVRIVLGLLFGFSACLLTDLHCQSRQRLGVAFCLNDTALVISFAVKMRG